MFGSVEPEHVELAVERRPGDPERTTSWSDNMASQRINAKLGYRSEGSEREARRGEVTTVTRFLLTCDDVEQSRPEWTVDVDGLSPCLPLLGADWQRSRTPEDSGGGAAVRGL